MHVQMQSEEEFNEAVSQSKSMPLTPSSCPHHAFWIDQPVCRMACHVPAELFWH